MLKLGNITDFGKFHLFGLILFSYLLSACQKDIQNDESLLDVELRQTLQAQSQGEGLAFYKLPESDQLSSIPQDPNNKLTPAKVELGKFLFHETHMALKPKYAEGLHSYSCASCHHAGGGFQANARQGLGDGGWGYGNSGETRTANSHYSSDSIDFQPIASPTILNSAYQELMLWNGQFGAGGANKGTESEWKEGTPIAANKLGFQGVETQAIAGLDVHRLQVDTTLITEAHYKPLFDAAFPEQAEGNRCTKINAALAIAAYERTVLANRAPFQKWLRGRSQSMDDQQKRGALLFFGKAQCSNCHSGPALNSMEFHALGMKDLEGPEVIGTVPENVRKGRGGFTKNPDDDYKFKVPQLYSLAQDPFLGHGSSFSSIEELIQYKNNAEKENEQVPDAKLSPDFRRLNLNPEEIADLTAFVEKALNDTELSRYEPMALPSGYCFPNNDPQSAKDRGCE